MQDSHLRLLRPNALFCCCKGYYGFPSVWICLASLLYHFVYNHSKLVFLTKTLLTPHQLAEKLSFQLTGELGVV